MTDREEPIAAILQDRGVVILDGGMATELERLGADLNDPLWSAKVLVESPNLIERVHYDYFVAGADVATTASYQATFAGFAQRGIGESAAAELLRSSVLLAAAARDRFMDDFPDRPRPLVAASIGCYGASLADGSEYRGDYGLSPQQLIEFHRPRMEALAASEPDLLACETIPCQEEAEALVAVLEDFPEVSAWISFSCRDDRHVCHGELLAECVAIAEQSDRVAAVGVNCTAPKHVAGLLASAAATTSKPLVCYPNSGQSWDAEAKRWEGNAASVDFRTEALQWYQTGARLIGGCCRTTPTTIRGMADSLRQVSSE